MPAPMDVSSFRRDPHPPIDPLKLLGQFATTAHTLQTMEHQQRLFDAQTAVGRHIQSSMKPDGTGFDDAKLTVLMANDPVTRPLIAQALQDMHTRNIAKFTADHKRIEGEAATMAHVAGAMRGVIARATTETGPNGETIRKLERKHVIDGAGQIYAVSPHLKPQIVSLLGKIGNDPVEIYKRVEAMVQLTDTSANALQRALGVYTETAAGGVTERGFVSPKYGVTGRLPTVRHQPTPAEMQAGVTSVNPQTAEETTVPAGTRPMFQGGGGQAPGTGGLPAMPNVPPAPVGGPGAQPGQTMPGGFSQNFGGFITGAEIGAVSPPTDMSRQGGGYGSTGAPIDLRPAVQRTAQAPAARPAPSGATYATPLPRARPEDLGAVVSPEVVPVQPAPAVTQPPSARPQAQGPVPFPQVEPRVTKVSPMVQKELEERGGQAKKIIEDITAEGNSSADMKQVIQKVTETFDSIQEGTFQPGAGTTAKEFIARMASALGVPEKNVDRITHLGRAQEYEKLSLQVAVLQLKKFMEGAGRFTNLEFDSFRKANPNWETDVRAVRQVLGFMDKMADIALQKQAALDAWTSGSRPPGYERAGMDQFSAAWNKLLKDKGVLDTVYDDGRKLLQDLRVMRNRGASPVPQIIVRPQPQQ